MPSEQGDVTLAQILKALTETQDLMRQTQTEQGEAIRSLARRVDGSTNSEPSQPPRISLDALEAKISEFYYEPSSDITFDIWYNRYEEMFVSDFAVLSDGDRTRLLFRHVHLTVEKQYKDFVAPAKITDDTFDGVVRRMRKLFGQRKSLFERRIEFLNLRMSTTGTEDLKVLASMVNRAVHSADIILCKEGASDEVRAEVNTQLNHWKCTLFVAAIDLPRYTDIRIHLLHVMKKDSLVTLDRLLDEVEGMNTLRNESSAVQAQSRPHGVHAVSKRRIQEKPSSEEAEKRKCDRCGVDHSGTCYFADKECYKCKRIGHRASMCRSKVPADGKRQPKQIGTVRCDHLTRARYVEKFRVNGKVIDLKIDSGSDLTFISEKVWKSIGKPQLTDSRVDTRCANELPLTVVGKFTGTIEYKKAVVTGIVYVTKSNLTLLGMDFAGKLGFRVMHCPEMRTNLNCLSIETSKRRMRNDCAKRTKTEGPLEEQVKRDKLSAKHSRSTWKDSRLSRMDNVSKTDKRFRGKTTKTARSTEKSPESAGEDGCDIWKVPQCPRPRHESISTLIVQQSVKDDGHPEEREKCEATTLQSVSDDFAQICSLTPRNRLQSNRHWKRAQKTFIATGRTYPSQVCIDCSRQNQDMNQISQSVRKRSPGNTGHSVGQLVIEDVARECDRTGPKRNPSVLDPCAASPHNHSTKSRPLKEQGKKSLSPKQSNEQRAKEGDVGDVARMSNDSPPHTDQSPTLEKPIPNPKRSSTRRHKPVRVQVDPTKKKLFDS